MKPNLITDVVQAMLPYLSNAQIRFFINVLEMVCETHIATTPDITHTNIWMFCRRVKQFTISR